MLKTNRFSFALLIGLLVLLGSALAQNTAASSASLTTENGASAPASTGKSFAEHYPRYQLQSGDSFDVVFELNPEFNQTLTVQPDGFVTLRGIGDMRVKDLTMPQLTEKLRSTYAKILSDPRITIVLKDFEKSYFIADGQVAKPGKYDLRGDTTLSQAVAMAGGFLDSAKHSQVLLFRKASEGWYSAKIFNLKRMENTGNLQEDPQLRPGDMIFVPRNKFSKIKAFLPTSNVGTYVRPY